MNFPQLRAFYHTAREGGVNRAALLMGVAQPTVSQHIKGLEARYGVRLFERRGRALRLTEAGRELLSVTEPLIRAAADVDAALSRPQGLAGGRLRITSDNTSLAVELLDLFRRRHADVDVSIRIASMAQVVAEVAAGAADVGVTVEPPAGDDLIVTPLRHEPLDLVLPRDHPLARDGRACLADLAAETLILREPGSRTRALTERALLAEGVAPRAVLEIGARDAIREAVARGMGVSLFARSEAPPDPRLARATLAPGRIRLGFVEHLVLRKDRRRLPAIAAFAEIAAAFAQGAPQD